MTPIQKAKEIIRDFLQCYFGAPFESDDPKFQLEWERWLQTKSAAALLSGEDWISVEDRLPEPGDIGSKKYLLLCHGHFAVSSYLKGFNSKYDEENKKDGFRNYDGSTGGYHRFNPTHWMEIPALPQPPKP